jgi:hypothetical protein
MQAVWDPRMMRMCSRAEDRPSGVLGAPDNLFEPCLQSKQSCPFLGKRPQTSVCSVLTSRRRAPARAQERVDEMIAHLAGLAEQRIVLSFAPSTPYYEVLKRVGELFPKGAKVPPPRAACSWAGNGPGTAFGSTSAARTECLAKYRSCTRMRVYAATARDGNSVHRPWGRRGKLRPFCAGLASRRAPPLMGRAPGQATRAYLHTEAAVEAAFRAAGWKVVRRELTATRFYFSRLFEAVRL